MTIKSGINYNRIASKLNAEITFLTPDTIPNAVLSIIINLISNDSTFEKGELILNHTQTEQRITFNNFHLFNIPLKFGYEIEKGSWILGAEAGVLINILTKRKGLILDDSGGLYDLKPDNQNWFKNNLGLRGILSLNLAYSLNENWKVSLSPSFLFWKDLNTDLNPIRQRHSALGLNFGVQRRF